MSLPLIGYEERHRRTGRTTRDIIDALELAIDGDAVALVLPSVTMFPQVVETVMELRGGNAIGVDAGQRRLRIGAGSILVLDPRARPERARGMRVVLDHYVKELGLWPAVGEEKRG